ncbi:MAG: sigma-54-dependent Fis family transcriptional regulator, partial [Bacteroidia bacterium]|nr:sigma-54-dependent Fis family transcriptional regulator [Bacteroidia bacterium]
MPNSSSAIKTFIVEDNATFTELMKLALENEFSNIEITHFKTGEECINSLHENPDIVSIDYHLPEMSGLELLEKIKNFDDSIKTIVVSGQEKIGVVLKIFKAGANDYLMKDSNCMPLLVNSFKNLTSQINLKKENEQLKEKLIDRNKYSKILGNSPALLEMLKKLGKAEKTNMTVLVTGESGTGKELVASAVHYNSERAKNPFVAVNMAAIPEELIESELFGHEKGSFTGADNRRIGKFEESDKGTIFLDEIGDMSTNLQSKLLRVIEQKEIVRIGSNNTIAIDLRVIAATNKDLKKEVDNGNFRQDLYFRLKGFLVHLPPLKERGDDIILLAKEFLKNF